MEFEGRGKKKRLEHERGFVLDDLCLEEAETHNNMSCYVLQSCFMEILR